MASRIRILSSRELSSTVGPTPDSCWNFSAASLNPSAQRNVSLSPFYTILSISNVTRDSQIDYLWLDNSWLGCSLTFFVCRSSLPASTSIPPWICSPVLSLKNSLSSMDSVRSVAEGTSVYSIMLYPGDQPLENRNSWLAQKLAEARPKQIAMSLLSICGNSKSLSSRWRRSDEKRRDYRRSVRSDENSFPLLRRCEDFEREVVRFGAFAQFANSAAVIETRVQEWGEKKSNENLSLNESTNRDLAFYQNSYSPYRL